VQVEPSTKSSGGGGDGKCLSAFPDLEKFHTVRFTDKFNKELGKGGIPYPNEWHAFMGKTSSGEYRFTGSMGGSFTVDASRPCVKSTGHEMGI